MLTYTMNFKYSEFNVKVWQKTKMKSCVYLEECSNAGNVHTSTYSILILTLPLP